MQTEAVSDDLAITTGEQLTKLVSLASNLLAEHRWRDAGEVSWPDRTALSIFFWHAEVDVQCRATVSNAHNHIQGFCTA